MASQRPSRPTCIRAAFSAAGFRKWQRHARHRLQVSSRRNLMDLAEGIWRECWDDRCYEAGRDRSKLTRFYHRKQEDRKFLDPYDGDSEDTPGHSNYRSYHSHRAHHLLGDRNRNSPSYTLKFRTAEEASVEDSLPKAPDLTMKASVWAPAALEVHDVDMQPEGELKTNGCPGRLSPSPEDWRMTRAASPLNPVETQEIGRQLLGRARATRSPPRLGSDRDKGTRLSLSKRKLELLLGEPERIKRKKK